MIEEKRNLGVVVHICNPRTSEAKAGGSNIRSHLGPDIPAALVGLASHGAVALNVTTSKTSFVKFGYSRRVNCPCCFLFPS